MPRKGYIQINLRVPNEMLPHLRRQAKNSGRSLNAEIVRRLSLSAPEGAHVNSVLDILSSAESAIQTAITLVYRKAFTDQFEKP